MSDSAAKGVVSVGSEDNRRDIVVSELTVAQMRQVIMHDSWPGTDATPEDLAHYQLDNLLLEGCRLSDLGVMANLTKADIGGLTGGELRKVLAKAKELNPDFFSALARAASARSSS
ncbi:hypothetical protein K8U54_19210 [Pseudomonas fulva]|uniref:hypothetical protein n=1 Tax=Pseudomonas fulva TaxID=47880 RepID=UPI00201E6475|nr:hypothetical protein [Pseudomonas fulva]UQY33820.1 hypothetical protein K8U54_19210 [Pseudomonas fulva]